MDQIRRIKDKLHLAGLVDRFRETFGSSSHQYFIDKPMSMNDVKAFEYKYEISLPSHYVDFMTQVGAANIDIGKEGRIAFAGPDYGVWDIRTMLHISQYIADEPLFDETVNKQNWEEKCDIDNISDEEYDDLSDKAYSGVLTISHTGCSGYMGLVLKGKNKGRIIWFSDEIEYAPSFCEEANFLDWYEAWLNRVISGKAFLSDYYFGKTEEELIERFLTVEKIHKDNHEYWKKVALSYLRGLKSLSDTALKVLWKAWGEERNQNIRYYIFNILVKFDYANTIPALRELATNDPIEFIRNIHLFAFSVLPDWNDVLLEMRKSSTDSSLIQYLDFVNINNE